MKIKICGIKDARGLEATMAAGADFFGLVLAPESPRFVDIEMARGLINLAGDKIASVVLLVNPTLDDALTIIHNLSPHYVQLHGQESPDLCAAIQHQGGRPIIKAIPITTSQDIKRTVEYADSVDYFLFDAAPKKNSDRHGGLGQVFDWSLLQDYNMAQPFFLAGGLHADNVIMAIDRVRRLSPLMEKRFYAVDVSSGVEELSGESTDNASKAVARKSPTKIKNFCAAVKKIKG